MIKDYEIMTGTGYGKKPGHRNRADQMDMHSSHFCPSTTFFKEDRSIAVIDR